MQSPNEEPNPPPEYTIGINNDDGHCYGTVIRRDGKPVAALIAREGEVAPLVRAGNCQAQLLDALKEVEAAIEEATDIMFSGEDGTPVSFLKTEEIEAAYLALVGVMIQVHEAINAGDAA